MTETDLARQALTLGRTLWRDLRRFPWRNTALTLRERFREDRLGVTASSLTFTTTLALVPLFSLALAVFSLFPVFERLQSTLQRWLVQSLVPDHIARPVMAYLNQFAAKATQMGWAGALVLLATALALVLTIDRKLNDIWRVRQARPLAQRVLVYWAVLTLGPLLLGASLSATSYALSASRGVWRDLPGGMGLLVDGLQFLLVWLGAAALYRYVPNTRVQASHALLGGLFVAGGLELAKKLLAWYLGTVPTYSVVYGTFATVPILLIWIYLAWVIVLLGAVVAAYLPSLLSGVARRGDTPGWGFQLALEMASVLWVERMQGRHGLGLEALAQRLRVDPLQLEEPLAVLRALDWVGMLDDEEGRLVLLVEPSQVPLAPLAERLLLARLHGTRTFWRQAAWSNLTLAQAMPEPGGC